MIALALGLVAAYGVHLAWTATALKWSGLAPGPTAARRARQGPSAVAARWLAEAGLEDVAPKAFLATSGSLGAAAAMLGTATFGPGAPAAALGVLGACGPTFSYRARRRARRQRAQEAWPRLIEEVRILTSSVGRSIPQALFEAANHGPDELRDSFAAAHREWLITTDFDRTMAVLKARLSDPGADATCETLLVAHEVGGSDLDRRLEALAADRRADMQGRRDARAEQAGVRFARRFVLIVPFGMAVAGMSVGNGRAAYQTPTGQAAVIVAMMLVTVCWLWASRIMALPEQERVFS